MVAAQRFEHTYTNKEEAAELHFGNLIDDCIPEHSLSHPFNAHRWMARYLLQFEPMGLLLLVGAVAVYRAPSHRVSDHPLQLDLPHQLRVQAPCHDLHNLIQRLHFWDVLVRLKFLHQAQSTLELGRVHLVQ